MVILKLICGFIFGNQMNVRVLSSAVAEPKQVLYWLRLWFTQDQ